MPPQRQKTVILIKKWGAAMAKSKITVKLSGRKATDWAGQKMPVPGQFNPSRQSGSDQPWADGWKPVGITSLPLWSTPR
jgi:hypothetical protein